MHNKSQKHVESSSFKIGTWALWLFLIISDLVHITDRFSSYFVSYTTTARQIKMDLLKWMGSVLPRGDFHAGTLEYCVSARGSSRPTRVMKSASSLSSERGVSKDTIRMIAEAFGEGGMEKGENGKLKRMDMMLMEPSEETEIVEIAGESNDDPDDDEEYVSLNTPTVPNAQDLILILNHVASLATRDRTTS